jgi:hypothetical protein
MLIKFVRGKRYNGESYGPGYPESVVDVDDKSARIFLASGAAIAVEAQPLPPIGTLSTASVEVESRDPQMPRRRGRK